MEQEKYNDEIDLLEVFNNLLKSIYFFFNRWYKTLLITIVIGIILGGSIYLKDKSQYQNTMLGYSPVINPVLLVKIINSLKQVNKEDKTAIQKVLNLSSTEIENLLSIEADTASVILNFPRKKDERAKIMTTIEIKVQYKDTLDLLSLSKNLFKYIDNNPYVAKELILKKQELKTLIAQTDKELVKLDSLQQSLLKNAGKNPGVQKGTLVISNDQIQNFYHQDILNLTAQKQGYLRQLEHLTGFEPISQFKPAKIKERSIIKTVFATTGIIFAAVFFILVILEIRRKAIQLIRKK